MLKEYDLPRIKPVKDELWWPAHFHDRFEKTTGQNSSLERVLNFCQEHFREGLSIKMVASELSLSEGYISHLFAYRIHQSFPDYVNALRLNEAIHLMQQGGRTLSDISASCGFSSIRTFNRSFLKKYGITPSQYRKNMKLSTI